MNRISASQEVGSVQTPVYALDRVLIRFKPHAPTLRVAASRQNTGLDIEKSKVNYSDLEPADIPPPLSEIHRKFPVDHVEKIFKNTADPDADLEKTRSRFSRELASGQRTLDEAALLSLDLSRVYKIKFSQGIPVSEVTAELKKSPLVEYVEPDYLATADVVMGNDPLLRHQWAVANFGQTGGTKKSDIRLLEGWGITQGSGDIIVAVIDTGIDYTHPDLGGCFGPGCKVVGGYDYVNKDSVPLDDYGHGTHIAGTIAANSNNSLGIVGVCPKCRLYSQKFLNHMGSGYVSDALPALRDAVNAGARVLNNSWGTSLGYMQSLQDIINWATAQGVLVVASAGNGGIDEVQYPAGYNNVLSVAATTKTDTKATYSSYGSWVDVSAPGGQTDYVNPCRYPVSDAILSTISEGFLWSKYSAFCGIFNKNGRYLGLTGTSMAAPHVAGLAGLLFSLSPNQTPKAISTKITANADSLNSLNPDYIGKLGSGRINVYRAVRSLAPPPPLCSYPATEVLVSKCNVASQIVSKQRNYNLYFMKKSDELVSAYFQYGILSGQTATAQLGKSDNCASGTYTSFRRYTFPSTATYPEGYLPLENFYKSGTTDYFDAAKKNLQLSALTNLTLGSNTKLQLCVRPNLLSDLPALPVPGTELLMCSYKDQFGSVGSASGQFNWPSSIAVDPGGNIYVTDKENYRVQKFDSAFKFLKSWGSIGDGPGQFNYPTGLAIDSSGNILVGDLRNNRIQKFDPDGKFISSWGTTGSGDGQFEYVYDLALDTSGNIYVTDGNDRVQKFDSNGRFLTKWGSTGAAVGQFNGPVGIAVDKRNNVYVTDVFNKRIQKFTSSGIYITSWVGNNSVDDFFMRRVTIDPKGYVIVTDADQQWIRKFSSNLIFLSKIGASGMGNGEFRGINGLTYDSSGRLYVAEESNNRIQRFTCPY